MDSFHDRFCGKQIANKSYNELVGLCKGIIADREVNQSEAVFLLNWLEGHEEVRDTFPANILVNRLAQMLADQNLDREESAELLQLLQEMTGEKGQNAAGDCPTTLCFDKPLPDIDFREWNFCLTGTFQSGQRSQVAKVIEACGGNILKDVVKTRPCCLVVGSLVTRAWYYSTHGRKIEKAVAFRDEEGCPVHIVSEDHLWSELERNGYELGGELFL